MYIYLGGSDGKKCNAMQENAMQETQVWSLGREDPLEKGMATPLQYSCLENSMVRGAWQTTQSMGSQRVGMTEQLALLSLFQKKKRNYQKLVHTMKGEMKLYTSLSHVVSYSDHYPDRGTSSRKWSYRDAQGVQDTENCQFVSPGSYIHAHRVEGTSITDLHGLTWPNRQFNSLTVV